MEGIAIAGVRGLLSLFYFILKVPDYPLSSAFVFFAPGLINHNQGAGASGVKNPFYAEDNCQNEKLQEIAGKGKGKDKSYESQGLPFIIKDCLSCPPLFISGRRARLLLHNIAGAPDHFGSRFILGFLFREPIQRFLEQLGRSRRGRSKV